MREIEEAARRKREADAAANQAQAERDADRPARVERAQRLRREVRLEFAQSWPTKKEDVVDAVMTWAPLKSAAWDGDVLVLDSDELPTTDRITGRGTRFELFTNHAVHTCFWRIARDVVPKLAAAAPIRAVQWTIHGKVEPWDAKV